MSGVPERLRPASGSRARCARDGVRRRRAWCPPVRQGRPARGRAARRPRSWTAAERPMAHGVDTAHHVHAGGHARSDRLLRRSPQG